MGTGTFLIRIIICFVLSMAIGIERQYRHRMVGLRTNVLVSLGAFMFMCISFGVKTSDETRIAAQIVSGIGFLGAGVILRDGDKIKGLNTAATLWCVSAIGVLTSSGLLFEAFIGTILVLFSNILLRVIAQRILDKLKQNEKVEYIVDITCEKEFELSIRQMLIKLIDKNNLTLQSLERTGITKEEIKLNAFIITSRSETVQEIINNLSTKNGVNSISWSHKKSVQTDNEDDEESIND